MDGVVKALETGRGRVVMRGVANFEDMKNGRVRIVVTEVPFMVNKASMIEKTAALINDKKIEGISELRDESDRNGIRVVYELKTRCGGRSGFEQSFQTHAFAIIFQRKQYCARKRQTRSVESERFDSSFRRAQARSSYSQN